MKEMQMITEAIKTIARKSQSYPDVIFCNENEFKIWTDAKLSVHINKEFEKAILNHPRLIGILELEKRNKRLFDLIDKSVKEIEDGFI